jgi:PGF-CTERM protein
MLVLSVIAASTALSAGAVAASEDNTTKNVQYTEGNPPSVSFGTTLNVTGIDAESSDTVTVRIRDSNSDDGDTLGDLITNAGEFSVDDQNNVTIDTNELGTEDGLDIDTEPVVTVAPDGDGDEFEVAKLTPVNFEFSFEDSSVRAGTDSEETIDVDANPLSVDLTITELDDSFSDEELVTLFPAADAEDVNDGAVSLSLADTNTEDIAFDPSESIEAGNYTFEAEIDGIGTTKTADVEILKALDGSVEVNTPGGGGLAEVTRGDVATFTLDLENTNQASVTVSDSANDYVGTLKGISPKEGRDTVTVHWNTYTASSIAGETEEPIKFGDSKNDVFEVRNGSADTVVEQTNEYYDDNKLVTREYTAEGKVGESVEDILTINLKDAGEDGRAVDAISHTAPRNELTSSTDFSEIPKLATQSDTVASVDTQITAFEIDGLSGNLTDPTPEVTRPNTGEGISVNLVALDVLGEPSEPIDVSSDAATMYTASESNQFYVALDVGSDGYTSDNPQIGTLTADKQYGVELSVDPAQNSYLDEEKLEDPQTASASFSVEDPTIDITGQTDDEDRSLVPVSEDAEFTGTTNLAPGTEVRARARATGQNSFTESLSGEVDENGDIAIPFDTSSFSTDATFSLTLQDERGTASDEVTAVFGQAKSADSEPQSQFQVTGLQPQDATLDAGTSEFEVSATVSTEGDAAGNTTVEFRLNGETLESENVSLDAGNETSVSFTADISGLENGSHTFSIATDDDDAEGSLQLGDEMTTPSEPTDESNNTDSKDDDSSSDPLPGFSFAVALLAILGAGLLALRRQQ